MKIFKNPIVIIFSIISGILTGIFFKTFAINIKIFGTIYLSLLKMCVTPILITAIISSIASLFKSKDSKTYIKKFLTIFLIFLFFTGVVSIVTEILIQPGENIGKKSQIILGKLINKQEKKNIFQNSLEDNRNITQFIKNMIPENIFSALTHGKALQILFFAILVGIATGFLPDIYSSTIINFNEAFFKAFFKIIDWIMLLLPFGLFSLISSQIANTGTDILTAMIKFIISIYILSVILMIFNGFIIGKFSKCTFFDAFIKLKEPLLIGLGTQSTFAAIPSSIESLEKNLKLNKEITNLVIPVGAVICRFSMVVLYSTATVFTAQLYNISLGIKGYLISLILSVIAAVAGAGTPGIVSIAMISIVLSPLHLPVGAIIILLLAINPLIDPVLTMANIHSNCAATSIIASK